MAKTKATPFEAFTKRADSILTHLGSTVTSITADVQKLAVVVVEVRESISRSITSKRTAKAVTVPDWDGRSPEYREWFNDTLLPLIEQRIPAEYLGTIRTRLQNQVQEEWKRKATPAQLAHLGLSKVSKAKTAAAKTTAAKVGTERPSDESFTTDGLVAHVKDTPIADAAQSIAAMCETLSKRVTANKGEMTKAQRDKTATLLGQALQYLMSARSNLMPATTPAKTKQEKVAA